MRVVIAGSSGLLGQKLIAGLLGRGHEVTRLVRSPPSDGRNDLTTSQWDPYAGEVDADVIAGAQVVINLAGSPLIGNPHSSKWATELRRSRVTTTEVLATAIAAAPSPPAFLAGNGISYYGDHRELGDPVLDETSDSVGDALLTDVTRGWQTAADPALEAGSRVCFLRTAPVMDRASAPLKLMLPLYKVGGTQRLGDGAQHFPIISLRDWVAAVCFLAESDSVSGPVNLCCPDVPTNAEFTRALAEFVNRPALGFIPAPLIRLAAGPLAPEVLGSVRAAPAALLAAGYEFHDVDVRDILAAGISPQV